VPCTEWQWHEHHILCRRSIFKGLKTELYKTTVLSYILYGHETRPSKSLHTEKFNYFPGTIWHHVPCTAGTVTLIGIKESVGSHTPAHNAQSNVIHIPCNRLTVYTVFNPTNSINNYLLLCDACPTWSGPCRSFSGLSCTYVCLQTNIYITVTSSFWGANIPVLSSTTA
jgi:hypothetical protein